MAEYELDMRGRSCPEPVVETRRLLLTPDARRVVVWVDGPSPADNVCRLAASLGWDALVEIAEDGQRCVTLARSASPSTAQLPAVSPDAQEAPASCGAEARTVVLISSDRFGEGDDALGGVLMRAFVKTLVQLDRLPETLFLVNGGVRLAAAEAPLVADLEALEGAGVAVLACGTCLDFYRLKDRLAVGRVTNMLEIVTALATAHRVIRP
jgi:selenium metabolism protein YedF